MNFIKILNNNQIHNCKLMFRRSDKFLKVCNCVEVQLISNPTIFVDNNKTKKFDVSAHELVGVLPFLRSWHLLEILRDEEDREAQRSEYQSARLETSFN